MKLVVTLVLGAVFLAFGFISFVWPNLVRDYYLKSYQKGLYIAFRDETPARISFFASAWY